MKKPSAQRLLITVWMFLTAVSVMAPNAAAQSRPATGQKAGTVSALLPTAKFYRGSMRNPVVTDAKKGDDVLWNDLVRTEKGGRARITLNDQSILSLGSQAELRVVKHDSRSQQTALQLGYGRVRAEVAAVTRDGGRFELRTPTAVAGVIGTDFGTDSSIPGVTNFLCISGIVQVSNSDPNVPGTVPCPAGSTTTVQTGLAPSAPKPATQQQIQQLIQDTEPAVISSLSPASSLPGLSLTTAASGSKMAGINAVTISGTGVTVSLQGTPTEDSATVNVVIAADATPGARTIIFTKANGQTTAAVFSVLAPPGSTGTVDLAQLKKAYTDLIESQRQSEITGLNAIGIGVQQSAADTLQLLLTENAKLPTPLPQSQIEKELGDTVAALLNEMGEAGKKINDEASAATAAYNSQADAAFARVPENANRDENLRRVAKEVFDRVNAELAAKFKGIHNALGGTAKSVNAQLNGAANRWMNVIRQEMARQPQVPTPKVDAEERSFEVGVFASFDAARSLGTGTSSIANYQWVLCDPSYKPQAIGVVLPANAPGCRPISGYAATGNEFKFQTCMLPPTDYIARVTVTDTNGKSSAMDVRVRVNQPQYENPAERLRSLADTYQALQPQQFVGYFDANYSGLTALQENIRRTFESLASMNINLRISQASIACNEATVRADWEQKYTFKADQTCLNTPVGETCQRVVFNQNEQLTVRMQRTPGRGWYISEFQGDNGTVQGTPPGPRIVDTALPDLELESLTLFSTPQAARENSVASGVAPGLNTFEAVVKNTGNGALTTATRVRFSVRDLNNNETAFVITELPAPLEAGASIAVLGQLNVPDLGAGTPARITAVVNGGCIIQERNCDGQNIKLVDVIIGTVDLSVANITATGTLVGTLQGQVTVQITNSGTRTSVPSLGNLKLLNTSTSAVIGQGSIPPIAAGATVTVPINFFVPNTPGSLGVTVRIDPASVAETNTANDSTTGSITIVAPVVDLRISALAYGPAGGSPFLSGQGRAILYTVTNAGNAPSSSTNTRVCTLSGGTPGNFAPVALPTLAPGQSVTGVPFTFTIPIDFAGSRTFTCSLSQDPLEPAALLADNSATLAAVINPNIDLQLGNVPFPTGADQMGAASDVTFEVKNFGLDTAPSGWNVVLRIGGGIITTYTHTAGTLAGNATVPITMNYTTPSLAPPPVDQTYPASLTVNENAAVPETTTTNNVVTRTLRLADFQVNLPTATLNVTQGVPFSHAGAVQILPNPYPAGMVNISFSGLPTGLTQAGALGLGISGTTTVAPGTYPVTVSGTLDGVTHTSASPLNIVVGAGFVDLAVTVNNLSPGPWLSGQTKNLQLAIANNGTVPSSSFGIQRSCTLNGIAITAAVTVPSINPGGQITFASIPFTVPANQAPTGNVVCSVTLDGSEPNSADNSAGFSVGINPNVDLQMVSLSGPAIAAQYGATEPFTLTVQNNGPDNAPGGWSIDVTFNAQLLGTVTGVPLSAGASNTFGPGLLVQPTGLPSAPFDISAPTGLGAAINAGGIGDANTGNNTIFTSMRVVDFTLTVLQPTVNVTSGAAFTVSNVIQIQPASYPLPITLNYSGLPAGVAAAGTNGTGLSGTVTAPGTFPLTAGANVNGVLKVTPAFNLVASTATANYAITSATLNNHAGGSTGVDSFVTGENVIVDVVVTNTSAVTETGSITVNATVNPGALVFSGFVSAPPAGTSVTAQVTVPVTGPISPGSYTKGIGIVMGGGLTDSTPSDNTMGPFNFEVYDFTLTDITGIVGPQNVPVTGSASLSYQVSESGPAAPSIVLSGIAVTPAAPAGVSYSFSTTADSGTHPININTAGATTNTNLTLTVANQRFGQTRSFTHDLHFYSGLIDITDPGDPGDTSVSGVQLLRGGSAYTANFQLVADFDSTGGLGNITVIPPAGITFSIIGSTTAGPGDPFQIQFAAQGGATLGPQAVQVKVQVPNTNPVQYIVKNFWVTPSDSPDLAIGTIFGANTFARDFDLEPILLGEGGDFAVQVQNVGSGPSSGGQRLRAYLGGYQIGEVSVPSIAGGGSYNATLHVRVPDNVGNVGPQSISFNIEPEANESGAMLSNNNSGLGVEISDWELSATFGQASPIGISLPGPGTSSTTVLVNVLNGGAKAATINLAAAFAAGQGSISTFLSQTGLPFTLTGSDQDQTVGLQIQTSPAPPNGDYAMTVFAELVDGGIRTRRQVTIHIQVGGGASAGTVSIATNAGNVTPGTGGSCTGPCSPVQINGLEIVSLDVTPSGGTGTTDLIFTDDGSRVVSRVTSSGTHLTPYITAAPYNSPQQVYFGAQETTEGSVNPGAGTVVVSAVAAQGPVASRDAIVPIVGGQQHTLHFQVGDLSLSYPCFELPQGQTQNIVLTFTPSNGFNATVSYDFLGIGVQGLSVSQSTTGIMSSPYTPLTFTVTNPSNNIPGSVPVVFRITVPNGSAVKDFVIPMHLNNNNDCAAGALRGSQASREGSSLTGGGLAQSRWYRRPPSYSAVASRSAAARPAISALPDLQLSSKDVSFSPSIPKRGDTVNVMFKVANRGDADAVNVPIALQVNGKIVATDTFDVKAGSSTLAGLNWTAAAEPTDNNDLPIRGPRVSRERVRGGEIQQVDDTNQVEGARSLRGSRMQFNAALLIDPAGTVKQKSTVNKTVQVAGLSVNTPVDVAVGTGSMDRAFLEVGTLCIGFRLVTGSGGDCESGADVDINMDDFASKRFSINAQYGIADLGMVEGAAAEAAAARAQYGARAVLQVGHTYAVQLSGGKHGIFTVGAMFSPSQLAAEAQKYFGTAGVKVIRRMGGESNILQMGDVAASRRDSEPLVYFDLRFKVTQ